MLFEAILFITLVVSSIVIYVDRRTASEPPTPNTYIVRLAQAILPAVVLVFLIRSFIFEGFRIPSSSMKPTLVEGDFIIVDKYSTGLRLPLLGYKLSKSKVQRGDVIVFRGKIAGKNEPLIKRVIGLPGDHIKYQNRTLFINGKAILYYDLQNETELQPDGTTNKVIRANEEIAAKKHSIYLSWDPIKYITPAINVVVPADSYFVLGDYRDNSQDSRDWGVVADRAIVGKARYILLSVDTAKHRLRPERIGCIH